MPQLLMLMMLMGRGNIMGKLLPMMISFPATMLGTLMGKRVTPTDALMTRMLGPIGLMMLLGKPKARYRRRRRRYYRPRTVVVNRYRRYR